MKRITVALIIPILMYLCGVLAHAQSTFPTTNPNSKAMGGVMMCFDASGVAVPNPTCYAYTNLAALATTTIKTGKGWLRGVTINTKGATANVLTIYDSTAGSGTKIATIDTTAGGSFNYDLEFTVGLTVVMAAGTAADITVTWK